MLFVRDLWYVCACVYESSEASAYSFGLATNPTRAQSYPLNINPKPDLEVADLYYSGTRDTVFSASAVLLYEEINTNFISRVTPPVFHQFNSQNYRQIHTKTQSS